jgi:hypothetical protein
MIEALQSIALGARSESREFMVSVAAKIKRKFGADTHLCCNSKEEQKYYFKHRDQSAFASINVGSLLIERAFDADVEADDVFAAAAKYERKNARRMLIWWLQFVARRVWRQYQQACPSLPTVSIIYTIACRR